MKARRRAGRSDQDADGGERGDLGHLYSATNQFNKNIVLNGNGINNSLGTINNASGNNTIAGPMTLNGNVEITFRNANGNAAGGSLTLSNTISEGTPGSLTKEDTNTLTVAGTDSYSGGTTINDGTFILNGINNNTANTLTVNSDTLGVPTTVGGNGTNAGPVSFNGDQFWPGVGGQPSTFGSGNFAIPGTPEAHLQPGERDDGGWRGERPAEREGDFRPGSRRGPDQSGGSAGHERDLHAGQIHGQRR